LIFQTSSDVVFCPNWPKKEAFTKIKQRKAATLHNKRLEPESVWNMCVMNDVNKQIHLFKKIVVNTCDE